MIAENRPASNDPGPSGPTRANLWLGGLALVLLGAVVTLVIVLLRRDGAPVGPVSLAPAMASGARGAVVVDGGAARPYVNLLDPKVAPPLAGATPSPSPSPSPTPVPDPDDAPDPDLSPQADPFGSLLKSLSNLAADPALDLALKDLKKSLSQGASILGKAFGSGAGIGAAKGSGAPGGKGQGAGSQGAGAGSDPLSRLLNQALSFLGSGAGSLGGGLAGPAGSGRIEASVADTGRAYVVSCRFPLGAPETASFRVRGETLIVKARFAGVGDEEQEVELPGAVHPIHASSELKGGQLVITLPKN